MLETKNYLVNNECYKVGKKLSNIKGVMVHSTATPGAMVDRFVNSWNTFRPNGKQVCVHAFIDDTRIANTLPYNIRCWGCGKGNKGSGNNNYIQIEICEPSEVYFTNGWQYNSKDKEKTEDYLDKVIYGLVEFIVNRLRELGINEINKDTVTSHYEAYQNGIASNHGDPAGLLGLGGYNMDNIRNMCKIKMLSYNNDNQHNKENDLDADKLTMIEGKGICSREKMISFLKKNNKELSNIDKLVDTYIKEGNDENIRYDIAFAQSILETGYFKFEGSAVELSDNNFGGLGVTQNGIKGNIYDTVELGIRAQIQHLKAYANTESLNKGCVDVRFKYVTRGCAPYVEWLGQKENPKGLGWASGKDYGNKILNILNDILNTSENNSDTNEFLVKVTTSALNVRSEPTVNSKKTFCIRDYGTYTIVETKGTWGKLKSGLGWISLNYTKRI